MSVGCTATSGVRPTRRLHDAPRCIVLMPKGDDLSPLLSKGPGRNGLGPHGFVYEDLRVLEATRRLILHYPEWRIPEMNRKLVERTTHPDALKAITDELGDAWQIHATQMTGETLAKNLTATERPHSLRQVLFRR